MPAATLRPIAVHVQEAAPSRFHWVLTERGSGNAWAEIQRAPAPASTYRQAMADGLLALQALIDDLDIGPRSAAAQAPGQHGPPGRRARQASSDAAPAPLPARRSLFGFGPAT